VTDKEKDPIAEYLERKQGIYKSGNIYPFIDLEVEILN
jgi:hypothetical protein